jgi:endonuclease/exonuclease/phosphatase family metal-dependent hydrolase
MKLVSWNCKAIPPYNKEGFTEEKAMYINKYNADIYVIQECTLNDCAILKSKGYKELWAWFGDNVDSPYGVGVFSDKYTIEPLTPEHNPDYRYIVPYKISNGNDEFVLFAVWTKDKDKENKNIEYTEQMWKAINFDEYTKFLSGSIILVGDFNSNNYWDKQYSQNKVHSHKDIINKLKDYGIESAYHKYHNCENGNEKEPTLLWKMDKNKQYHIDYCFVSDNFEIKNVQIGSVAEWEKTKFSDHCPLIIELK